MKRWINHAVERTRFLYPIDFSSYNPTGSGSPNPYSLWRPAVLYPFLRGEDIVLGSFQLILQEASLLNAKLQIL
ncbi:hypothetical protein OUZ56_016139 [Daphnia magna]|uniref:Uncharacterized protein n=1 Tax=Daphnia magna TaxID=35525 RepID=A0ABR0APV5_9CRUS|nr:hypothetical protein OUZ56_016139 [Daphnia magna]